MTAAPATMSRFSDGVCDRGATRERGDPEATCAFGDAEAVLRCLQVAVAQRSSSVLETRQPIGIGRKRGRENLQRDITLQLRVARDNTSPIPPHGVGR